MLIHKKIATIIFFGLTLFAVQQGTADIAPSFAIKTLTGYVACGYGFASLLHHAAPSIDTYMEENASDAIGKQVLRTAWNVAYAAMIPAMLMVAPCITWQKNLRAQLRYHQLWSL